MLNLYMLAYQHDVEHSIIHFVALEVIIEIPHFFVNSLQEDRLKDKIFSKNHHLHFEKCMKWEDRTFRNKVGRVIFKFWRLFYVACIFYFQPYIVTLGYGLH